MSSVLKAQTHHKNLRLDRLLAELTGESRSLCEKLIRGGHVDINGETITKPGYKVQVDDAIEVEAPEPQELELTPWDHPLDIIFEDDDVIVINKPAGIVVHPSAGHPNQTLVNALLHHCGDLAIGANELRPGIVHRLDRDTSGLLVIAKTNTALKSLSQQFQEHSIHRIYQCLVWGTPPTEGEIESYLIRHPNDRKRFCSLRSPRGPIIRPNDGPRPETGKYSKTTYQLLKEFHPGVSLLRLKLHTGRTHQIRIHMSEMGHGVLGDPIYGKPRKGVDLENWPRIALHAMELGFQHPTSEKSMTFKTDWPEDTERIWSQLKEA